jgi:hypothetical protein
LLTIELIPHMTADTVDEQGEKQRR